MLTHQPATSIIIPPRHATVFRLARSSLRVLDSQPETFSKHSGPAAVPTGDQSQAADSHRPRPTTRLTHTPDVCGRSKTSGAFSKDEKLLRSRLDSCRSPSTVFQDPHAKCPYVVTAADLFGASLSVALEVIHITTPFPFK